MFSKHGTTTPEDLYEAFDTVMAQQNFVEFSFADAFSSWEVQKGFPVLHVTANDFSRSFSLFQQRYYAASEERVLNDDRSWHIPLNFATESNPDFDDTTITNHLFAGATTKTIPFPELFDSSQWFVFNKQQIGFYRVDYDLNNWRQLIKVLNSDEFTKIHVLNRAQLIDDALNLAADGYLGYDVAFQVLAYLSRETDYIPWRAAIASLDKIDHILAGQPVHANYRKFVRHLARRIYVAHGLEEKAGESYMDRFARELAIDWTCRMGDAACLAATYSQLQEMAIDKQAVPASLEVSFICNGLRGLDREKEFAEVARRMQNSNDQAERLRIIDGLLCSSDPQLILDLLQSILVDSSETNYKPNERSRILFNSFTKSSVGFDVILDFIPEYYDDIVDM